MPNADLIVFSHLRWNFVYQRPQHLLSRFAQGRRVIFVEEPLIDESAPARWEIEETIKDIVVCRPRSPIAVPGFSDEQMPLLASLVRDLLREINIESHDAWFYSPLALPLLEVLKPRAVIYDCMDELSAFLHAPRQLLDRERELLSVADVVFTGGPSLYRAKKDRHPNVHCFSSSVDAAHFSKAKEALPEPADQLSIGRPRFGYFGVIDERIDLSLIDALAQTHPEWQIVMVGPVVKIDPAMLPRHANLHYLGQKQYAELPSYLSGWDVCLLPFARNDATRFISPTKTLEYMAAEKPIVSTPITDVAEPYGAIVYLGDTPAEFIARCEEAFASSNEHRAERIQMMRQVLSRTSWDQTAHSMSRLIHAAAEAKHYQLTLEASDSRKDTVRRDPVSDNVTDSFSSDSDAVNSDKVVIVGAGPTGLSAAYHLGDDAVLLEREQRIGGWCRSMEEKGFTFDYAGHIMFSNDPYVHELYKTLLGDNVHWQDREAWVFSKEVYTRYPFQGALYGLPPNVIKECIVGAIEARFGSVKKKDDKANPPANVVARNGTSAAATNGTNGTPANATATNGSVNGSALANVSANGQASSNGHTKNGHADGHTGNGSGVGYHLPTNGDGKNGKACGTSKVEDCCGDGVMEATASLGAQPGGTEHTGAPRNFEEFIYKVWGAGIAKHFAIPYNRKLWAVPLSEMETSWLGGRVPLPDLEEMIEGALQPVAKPMGPNARFGYPLRGGFQALMDGFMPHIAEQLRLGTSVAKVSPSRRTITLNDGTEMGYEYLISTMPLPVLIKSMGDEVPNDVREAAMGLRHVSVRCVHIGVGREKLTEKHWIYYPEDTVFHRIFVQGNASPFCNPQGGFGLTCEITYSPHKPLPCDGDALIQRCIEDCHKVGLFSPEDPVWAALQCDLPYAYVVYDHARPKNVALIRKWLEAQNILLAGRYSEWEYYNSDHAFLAGKKVADRVKALRAQVETSSASAS